MSYKLLFRAFLQELQLSKNLRYKSTQTIIQSSVGMIFRIDPSPQKLANIHSNQINSIDLLFTQRAGYHSDLNAYNIVFPGGQAQLDQDDFLACQRQLKQEIDLDVRQHCIYLGQIPKNFYYMKKSKSRQLYLNCHVWVLKKGYENWKPNLNPSQLIDYRWVPFQSLISLQNYQFSKQNLKGIIQRSIPKILSNYTQTILNRVTSMKVPILDIGMNKKLWGLTLWLLSYSLQMGNHRLIIRKSNQTNLINEINEIVKKIQFIQLKFNRFFLLGYPICWATKIWHNKYRVKPFTYIKKQQSKIYPIILILVLIIIIGIYWWYCQFLQLRYTVR